MRYVATRRVQVREGGQQRVHEERVVRDGPRLRVEFAPGSRYQGQIVIETPAGRHILDPTRRQIRRLPARGSETERRLGRFVRLVRGGEVLLAATEGPRVAGRATRRLVLSRAGQPFLALSVEPRTAVVLRRESFGVTGTEAGAFTFTSFDPRPKIAPANFVLPKAGYRLVEPLDDLRAIGRQEGIAVRTLPASTGYRLEGSRLRRTPKGVVVAAFFAGGGKRLTLFAANGELPDLTRRRGVGGGSDSAPRGVALYRWRVGNTGYGLLGEESPARLRALSERLIP